LSIRSWLMALCLEALAYSFGEDFG
jgi:hypothetical protein